MGFGLARPYMSSTDATWTHRGGSHSGIVQCAVTAPVAVRTLRSMRSTSSSFSTASLPCLRIHLANRGSVASTASAKSLDRHQALWNGQYAW